MRKKLIKTNAPSRRRFLAAFGVAQCLAPRALRAAPVNYTVPGILAVLRQPTPHVCWATAATMMASWKQNSSFQIATVMSQADTYTAGEYGFHLMFTQDKDLAGSLKPDLLDALGLSAEAPMNLTVDGWVSLLKTKGLLWVTTNEGVGSGPFFSAHARIISAIAGDGTPNGTFLTFVDPALGAKSTETITRFVQKFEELARQDHGAGADLRPQIAHF